MRKSASQSVPKCGRMQMACGVTLRNRVHLAFRHQLRRKRWGEARVTRSVWVPNGVSRWASRPVTNGAAQMIAGR